MGEELRVHVWVVESDLGVVLKLVVGAGTDIRAPGTRKCVRDHVIIGNLIPRVGELFWIYNT